ncbi:hypothetical protein E2C01_071153 [Portunus trituberculatus]|uniref:Uncharacterized protein n=1 Tax=Portunus trituberculatus TaxID=210409 RepID=A0A5B7I5H5_PORTR|nr:hypothetical protein [Portunus trituberculatus]
MVFDIFHRLPPSRMFKPDGDGAAAVYMFQYNDIPSHPVRENQITRRIEHEERERKAYPVRNRLGSAAGVCINIIIRPFAAGAGSAATAAAAAAAV